MRTRPTVAELRQAVADFRRTADPAALAHDFYSRVADNVDALIVREAALAAAADAAELARLREVLSEDGALPALNRALCQRIRDGEIDSLDPALLAHLRQTARETLAIDNPRYASYVRDMESQHVSEQDT